MFWYSILETKNHHKRLYIYCIQLLITWILFPVTLFGQVEFFQIFPNTIDDTNLEYIELRNTSCETLDIGWYILEDASTKQYIFPNPTIINSHDIIHISRPTSKIILNNSDETLYLRDSGRNMVDQFSYSTSTKWTIIIDIAVIDTLCTPINDPEDNNSGNTDTPDTNTGITNSGSSNTEITSSWDIDHSSPVVINDQSGSVSSDSGTNLNSELLEPNTNTGMFLNEQSETGTVEWDTRISESGTIQTGSIISQDSWNNTSDSTITGAIFPEIYPTIQYPSNVLFTWGIFDCTGRNPCRINISFEPIFTGWFLERDYTCEITTTSWSLFTCNPNTQYFSSWDILTFRITKKSDPNQSRSITWEIIYKSIDIISQELETNTSISYSISWTESTGASQPEITFPDISPTFQNYTNTTHSWDILICTTSPCRLNFTLEPIFTGAYIAKEYTCEVLYGTGRYDCNPPQLYLIGTGSVEIRLIHKSTQKDSKRILQVVQDIPIPLVAINQKNTPLDSFPDKNPPIVILEYDGKLKSYHDQIWEYEMDCYSFTCAINLTAEKSYDPEWWAVHFLWYYGLNDIKTTKDPWERKYWLWDHIIWLRVIDASGNVTSVKYYIHVLWPREKEEVQITKKQKNKISKPGKEVAEKWKTKKKPKTKKMVFFDPPKIVLQKSKFTEKDNTYICYTHSKSCSLNLNLSNSQKGIVYRWKYDDGEIIVSKNPKSRSFEPWFHTIQIIAWYTSDDFLWTQSVNIQVIKVSKPKKIKKVKKSKIVQNSWSIMEQRNINSNKNSDLWEQKSQDNTPITILAFLWGLMPILVLRKVFWRPTQSI